MVRSDDIERDARECPDALEVVSSSRGDFRWRIGIPADGHLPCGGRCATLIQWEGTLHPTDRLPDSGCRLVELVTGGAAPRARLESPKGPRWLGISES